MKLGIWGHVYGDDLCANSLILCQWIGRQVKLNYSKI